MATDVTKFQKLLASIGYSGRLNERKTAESFVGREDLLRFFTSELSKDNLVQPEKVQRLEELKRKGAQASGGVTEAYGSDDDIEMEEVQQEAWELVCGVLESDDSLQSVQDETKEELEVWKLYERKRIQLEGLEKRLRKSVQESNQRINPCCQRNMVLDKKIAGARNDARLATTKLEENRREYLQALEELKDLLENSCEDWFFPQADMTHFWKCGNSMDADIKQLQKLLCLSGGAAESSMGHPDELETLQMDIDQVPPFPQKNTLGDVLREATEFQSLSWFQDIQVLQMNRLRLTQEEAEATRRLHQAKAKMEVLQQLKTHLSGGNNPGIGPLNTATMLEGDHDSLLNEREMLLHEFPSHCLEAVEVSVNELAVEHLEVVNGEWDALNKKKRLLLEFLIGQLARYRAVETLSHLHSTQLKSHLPDMSFIHTQLEDLSSKSQLRRRLYGSKDSTDSSQDFIPSDDSFMDMVNRAVETSDVAVSLMRDTLSHVDVHKQETVQGIQRLGQLSPLMTPPNMDKDGQNILTGVFSPQSMCTLTPEPRWESTSMAATTSQSGGERENLATTVPRLCSKVSDLFSLHEQLSIASGNVIFSSEEGISSKQVNLSSDIGRIYALIFPERDSTTPSLSTNTIVDNFKSADSQVEEIDSKRQSVEEEFAQLKISLRGDAVKCEQRLMMCAFFSDQEVFLGKYLSRAQEADRCRAEGVT